MRMNRKLKDAWVKGLRSGKYKQGKQRLVRKRGDELRYCCLGVLCEIKFGTAYGMSNEGLPTYARQRDLGQEIPYGKLAMMNDSGYTFEGIADFIEKNIEGVNE